MYGLDYGDSVDFSVIASWSLGEAIFYSALFLGLILFFVFGPGRILLDLGCCLSLVVIAVLGIVVTVYFVLALLGYPLP